MTMKIGFFGSAPFVVEFLDSIKKSPQEISFIVTSPDKPTGRGRVITPPTAKRFAIENNIPFFQPEDIRSNEFLDRVHQFNVDIFLVIAYGKKLHRDLLYLPPKHSYNLHFSLLPRWRGAAPVNWAILSGDRETGLTIMKMDEGLDTGDIVFQKSIPIYENETASELFTRIIEKGKPFLIDALNKIEIGNITLKKQEEGKATYAPPLKKDDGYINWRLSAYEIHNKIRALQPWPSAFTFYRTKRIKILKSLIISEKGEPGKIIKIEKDGIVVATKEGAIKILELQEEGKNKVSASDYARGKLNLLNTYFDSFGPIDGNS